MKISYFFSILFFLFLLFVVVLFLANKEKFLVKQVEITADFNLDKVALMKRLKIENGWYIWQYSTNKIAAILDELYFIDDYTITKKYPSGFTIKLLKRKPLARLVGKEGQLFFIDRQGMIFHPSRLKEKIPLLLTDNREQIIAGRKMGGKYGDLVALLVLLQRKYPNLYREIAQLALTEKDSQLFYRIDFRAINKSISLKKKLNVENMVEALAVSKICEGFYDEHILLNHIENGYYYSYDSFER